MENKVSENVYIFRHFNLFKYIISQNNPNVKHFSNFYSNIFEFSHITTYKYRYFLPYADKTNYLKTYTLIDKLVYKKIINVV